MKTNACGDARLPKGFVVNWLHFSVLLSFSLFCCRPRAEPKLTHESMTVNRHCRLHPAPVVLMMEGQPCQKCCMYTPVMQNLHISPVMHRTKPGIHSATTSGIRNGPRPLLHVMCHSHVNGGLDLPVDLHRNYTGYVSGHGKIWRTSRA